MLHKNYDIDNTGGGNPKDEKFPFQPQPVSASATSASAICFFTQYFLK